jgi:hypothetical protein
MKGETRDKERWEITLVMKAVSSSEILVQNYTVQHP